MLSAGFTFQGKRIYARFAGMGGTHTGPFLSDWWRIGWLDLSTAEVSVGTMVYTAHA